MSWWISSVALPVPIRRLAVHSCPGRLPRWWSLHLRLLLLGIPILIVPVASVPISALRSPLLRRWPSISIPVLLIIPAISLLRRRRRSTVPRASPRRTHGLVIVVAVLRILVVQHLAGSTAAHSPGILLLAVTLMLLVIPIVSVSIIVPVPIPIVVSVLLVVLRHLLRRIRVV